MTRLAITAAVLTAAVAAPWAMTRADDPNKGQSNPGQQNQNKQGQGQQGQQGQRATGIEAARQYIKQLDKNGDGSLQRNELPADLRDGFDALDANHDGKLSAEELEHHAERLAQTSQPVELITFWVVEAPMDPPSKDEVQNVYAMLRKIDKNNDGQLSDDELKAAKQDAIQHRVDAIFKRCDKNHDGKISKDECPTNMQSLFDRTDKDHNGSVTKDELKDCCMKSADQSGHGNKSAKSGGSSK